jgi:signal transduction histidine kinase
MANGTAGAGNVHQRSLERTFGVILFLVAAEYVVQFWLSMGLAARRSPGSLAASLLLSLVLLGLGARALRRMPRQRDLGMAAVAAVLLMPASRLLAGPGSPFQNGSAYLLVVPVAIGWAGLSQRFAVTGTAVLIAAGTGVWYPGAALAAENTATTLATAAFAGVAARLLYRGARRADTAADLLSQRMAQQQAALAAEEAERDAANQLHDDVLSVLRTVSTAGDSLPWRVLVGKARRAKLALRRRLPADRGTSGLAASLRRLTAEMSTDLDVRCYIAGDLDVPAHAALALSAAAGEALRNVAAHAGTREATVSARSSGSGLVEVTVADQGRGFDQSGVGPASIGLRNSIHARLRDAGGHAEVASAPGRGTTVRLSWAPPPQETTQPTDPRDWSRRLLPRPWLIFLGFILPQSLSSLTLLALHWHDMRWPQLGVTVFAALFVLTAASARSMSQMRLGPVPAAFLIAALAALVAVGALSVRPGATDPGAYWMALESAVLVGSLMLMRGPATGLAALALVLAALAAGLLAAGHAVPGGTWVGTLASPVLGAGAGLGFLAAIRNLSQRTEGQLAEYRDRLRRQARVAALSRVDSHALANARRIAGPVLSQVASGRPPSDRLRTAAGLAEATIRDELLAPGLLTPALAERVRAARTGGARITIASPGRQDPALVESARQLLDAALTPAGAVGYLRLDVHPPLSSEPAAIMLHTRSRPGVRPADLTGYASRHGARLNDLGAGEVLLRMHGPRVAV